jgi:putative resolvase
MYSIGEFAKILHKTVLTLQRWDREGKLVAYRTPTNRRYYTEAQLLQYKGVIASDKAVSVAYVRVSNKNQKDDLKNQKDYINKFCLAKGLDIHEWYEDIGSGLNYNRKNFNLLLSKVEHGEIREIIIAHKDRLIRFGFEWFERFCNNHGCTVTIINDEKLSPEAELVEDLINIIHVFSCRIYGLRSYKKVIKDEFKK